MVAGTLSRAGVRGAGLVFAALVLFSAGPAAPHPSAWSGIAHRGPVGSARALVERAERRLAEGDPAGARLDAERLMTELRGRATDPDSLLDPEVVDGLVRGAIPVRDRALLAERGLGDGAHADFLAELVDAAVWADWRWDVPASLTLAQAILESNWGRSAPGFNLFGMKGEGPAGSTERRVVEYRGGRRRVTTAKFRAYPDFAGSLADHGRLLGEARVYRVAREGGEDPSAWARGLVGVYATDPRYARKLVRVIGARGLERFDWAPTAPWSPPRRVGPPAPADPVDLALGPR